jgi:HAD superfamily hydrolase (TIGR01549 family)
MTTFDISSLQHAYKGVLLDLDNTLYDYHPCHEHALAASYEFFNSTIEKIDQEEFNNLYLEGREALKKHNSGTAGSHSRHLYFQLMLEIKYGKARITHALQLAEVYWESFMAKMHLQPWVQDFLQDAKKHGIKIVVITNQESSLQYKKLVKLGIAPLIDFMVTSEEAGVEKPDPKIFSIALDKIGMKADEVVMISDDEHADGTGARNAGISFLLCG